MRNELPTHWGTERLGEVLPLSYGKGLPAKRRNESGTVPVFGSSGEVGRHNAAVTTRATLIIGRKGNVGKPFLSAGPCWPIDTVYFAEEVEGLSLAYMFYLLLHLDLSSLDKSTAIPGLSRDDYNAVEAPIAPVQEQHRIVEAIESYFTRLDDAMATLERAQRNLKRYRASVLKAAAEGRLVPTEAELARAEGRDYEPASVLLERILAERRRRWEEAELAKMKAKGKTPKDDMWKARYTEPTPPDASRLPHIPDGWCWVTVDQLLGAGLTNGRSVKTASSGFPVLRLTALRDGFIDVRQRKIGAWTKQDAEPYLVKEGDFLVSRGNGSIRLVGLGGLVRSLPDPIAYPDTMIRFRLCDGVAPGFFAQVWNSREVRDQLEVKAKTTAGIFKVNQGDLRTCVLPLPPRAEQLRIQTEIERMISEAEAAAEVSRRCSSRCARLRQSILKWAFEGRLVDQDPTDEPASRLLERIEAEREGVRTEGRTGARRRGKETTA